MIYFIIIIIIFDYIKNNYNNNKIYHPTGREELVEDVLQIMNIFVAKMNRLRKYDKL